MSYTEIFGFDKEGNAYSQADVHNGFRSGMAIWKFLEKKYLPPYIPQYARKIGITTPEECERILKYVPFRCTTIMEEEAMDEIWGLADRQDVSDIDRICLFTTFDNCLVKKDDIPKVIEAFRSFEGETSLKEQADILEQMYADGGCIAVGWNQTSVNGDTWANFGGYDEDSEMCIPYNCLTGTKHYWLFDELKTREETENV